MCTLQSMSRGGLEVLTSLCMVRERAPGLPSHRKTCHWNLSCPTPQPARPARLPPAPPHAQDVRIITVIEVAYTIFLNQAGVDNATDICANQEKQIQQLIMEAFGRLGIDRTEVGAAGAVLEHRNDRAAIQEAKDVAGGEGSGLRLPLSGQAKVCMPEAAMSTGLPPVTHGAGLDVDCAPLVKGAAPVHCEPQRSWGLQVIAQVTLFSSHIHLRAPRGELAQSPRAPWPSSRSPMVEECPSGLGSSLPWSPSCSSSAASLWLQFSGRWTGLAAVFRAL